MLDRAHVPLDDAKILFLSPGDCKAALQTGAVDAWATWAPYIGLATLHDADRVLIDGRGLLAGYSFMAASEAAIAAKRPLLADFVLRLSKAYAWGRANLRPYAAALARDTGMPIEVAADSIARQNVSPAPITPQIVQAERSTLDLFRRAVVYSSTSVIEGAFDPTFNAAWSL